MDYNERFGQIEALLANLLRRMNRWEQQPDSSQGIPQTLDEQPAHPHNLALPISALESRVRRLEDAVFNKAS